MDESINAYVRTVTTELPAMDECLAEIIVVVVVVVGLKSTKQLRPYSAQTLSKRAQHELH